MRSINIPIASQDACLIKNIVSKKETTEVIFVDSNKNDVCITLAIDESDLEQLKQVVYENKNVYWNYIDKNGQAFDFEFINTIEQTQRGQ